MRPSRENQLAILAEDCREYEIAGRKDAENSMALFATRDLKQRLLVWSNRGRETRSVGSLFRLAQFQVTLAGVGGLGWVHAGAETGLLQEVAPAFVSVGGTLAILVFAHGGFGVLASLDDFDYSSRDVGTHVVAN